MAILTAAIDAGEDLGTYEFPISGIGLAVNQRCREAVEQLCCRSHITHGVSMRILIRASRLTTVAADGDIRLVHIAREEGRTILVARILNDVWCCLTSTTTDDIAIRQLVLHAVRRIALVYVTYGTADDIHGRLTAVEELPGIVALAGARPQGAGCLLAVTGSSTDSAVVHVVIRTTGKVTLTHGSHVTTAIDISPYIAVKHRDLGVTHHLTSDQTVKRGGISIYTTYLS